MSSPSIPSPVPSAGKIEYIHTLQNIRIGALCTLGAYSVAVAYRVGVFRAVLPSSVNTRIEQVVNAIKKRTEPLGNQVRYATARKHLTRVYALTSAGLLTMAAGAFVFFKNPKIPIALPLATAIIPAGILLFMPRNQLHTYSRYTCFFVSCASCGYTMGPMHWVVQSSLPLMCMMVGSTMIGLTVPLFLTRGMVSYVVSSQVLSLSISFAIICSPLALLNDNTGTIASGTGDGSSVSERGKSLVASVRHTMNTIPALHIFRYIKETARIPTGDVNVLLTMQIISNVGITFLHTLPTIVRFVKWQGVSEDELLNNVADPVKEAMCICGATAYAMWNVFRWAIRRVMMRVTRDDTKGATKEVQAQWAHFANLTFDVNRASGIGASLAFVLWYMRMVSIMQSEDTSFLLDRLRFIFEKLSPLHLIVNEKAFEL